MTKEKIINAFKYMAKPRVFLDHWIVQIPSFLPDKLFISLRYMLNIGSWPNFKNPKTFNEKLQVYKLWSKNHPEFTQMVDKVAAKDYVASKIGSEYIIPTLGVWNSVDDIDWDSLPNQFVVKAAGDSGGIVICKDKSKLDIKATVEKLKSCGVSEYWQATREYPYRGVPHRYIAEKFMEGGNGELKDYKFFCFDGNVKFFKIDFGRFVEHHANYYDPQGNILPFGEAAFPPDFNHQEKIPENLKDMIAVAEKLSEGFPFLRVDLYNVSGRIYFGELTFFPNSGFGPFVPEEWDTKIGFFLTTLI